MFNIGAGELFIIFLVAFFIVGPKDLPKVIQGIKRALATMKGFIKDLKAETGWDEIVKEVSQTAEEVTGTLKSLDVSKDLKEAKKSVEDSVKDLNIQQDFEEAKNALENSAQAIKSPLKAAAASISAELDPKAILASESAEQKTQTVDEATKTDADSAAEYNIGLEAEKTEEKS